MVTPATASLAGTNHDGTHPCSLSVHWGGVREWEEPNTKQGCLGFEMSGGREPRLKDINKLQVSRDLPATL